MEQRSPKGNDRSPESHQDSVVKSGNISNSSALMYVIITCKYEKDPFKSSGEKKTAPPFFSL